MTTLMDRVAALLPGLPTVFTVDDVLAAGYIGNQFRGEVHAVLEELALTDSLHRVVYLGQHGLGRRPSAWSAVATEPELILSAVWEVVKGLQNVFTTTDVRNVLGLSERFTARIKTALQRLADDDHIRHGPSGRWYKGDIPVAGTPTETVEVVLASLPKQFGIRDVLAAVGWSERGRSRVVEALARLTKAGRVVRVTELKTSRQGRRPRLWSADPNVIETETQFRRAREAVLASYRRS